MKRMSLNAENPAQLYALSHLQFLPQVKLVDTFGLNLLSFHCFLLTVCVHSQVNSS